MKILFAYFVIAIVCSFIFVLLKFEFVLHCYSYRQLLSLLLYLLYWLQSFQLISSNLCFTETNLSRWDRSSGVKRRELVEHCVTSTIHQKGGRLFNHFPSVFHCNPISPSAAGACSIVHNAGLNKTRVLKRNEVSNAQLAWNMTGDRFAMLSFIAPITF